MRRAEKEAAKIENRTFFILGDDARQTALEEIFTRGGSAARRWDGVQPARGQIAVLPMPFAPRGDAQALLRALDGAALAVGGRISQDFARMAAQRGIRLADYALREDFAVRNALTTAQAAVCAAVKHTGRIVHGQDALVIGFGRIGRLLAGQLRALGARVTASARKSADLAWIGTLGYACADTRALPPLESFDLIFNTVPAPVLGARELAGTKADCLIMDLASAPGGVDLEAAKALSRRAVHEPGLPGRYAPYSAAESAAKSIYAILAEEEYGS